MKTGLEIATEFSITYEVHSFAEMYFLYGILKR